MNPEQARRLIAAVAASAGPGRGTSRSSRRIYFAGLRPAEVLALRVQDCTLPEQGWGELCFAESTPYVGAAWTDDGTNGPRKALKHRAANESRTVPAHPELVAHLRNHIEQFGTAEDGRLFVRANGDDIRYGSFASIWSRARKAALTDAQFNSPLGKRPYDLRHACVSTWLNAGVSAPQVAEWAGHSVQMLLGPTPSASTANTTETAGASKKHWTGRAQARTQRRTFGAGIGTTPTHRPSQRRHCSP